MSETSDDYYNAITTQENEINELRDSKIWLTADGSHASIKSMSTDHIINCVNLLKQQGDDFNYVPLFQEELRDRLVPKHLKKEIKRKNIRYYASEKRF